MLISADFTLHTIHMLTIWFHPPRPPSSCNKAVHGRSIRWVLGHAPGDYATFPRLTTSFVEKSFFLRAVTPSIVLIFFLILLILTSEPVLLNKLPLPHSPARTHLLLSIGANCHRHTHKNTHTHTVFINYDIHVQWSIWRHGKSWVQLLADNSWVLRTWLWIHLISSNCFSCSHHSLTHALIKATYSVWNWQWHWPNNYLPRMQGFLASFIFVF